MGFIPDDWLHTLDYSTLEKVSGSYVSDDFKQREDDIVWRVKVGGDWVYLYLLIEFQSSVDKYMALGMLVYIGLLYQDLLKQGHALAGGRLPPILPIVLYNGNQKWTAATNVADLIPVVPGLVSQFKPSLQYLLIDENNYADSELTTLSYRSHALRGNAADDALRHASLERCRMHSHAERGNDNLRLSLPFCPV